MSQLDMLLNGLQNLAEPKQAEILSRFFKTGPGQYGEGDQFLGIKVPAIRKQVADFGKLSRPETLKLLKSPWHEHRLAALLILVRQFEKSKEESERGSIYRDYLKHTAYINNWDLVDLSAPNIVGGYLVAQDRSALKPLALSKSLWERRIAMLATFEFIKRGEVQDAFEIARLLLSDKHDLIHKAVGWMLREIGKRVSELEEKRFLEKYYRTMPRTMLRYSIERFSPEDKAHFMAR